MRITVKAKPRAKVEKVTKINETVYEVSVVEPPVAGKANKAIIRALSKYFNTSASNIFITNGEWSKIKEVEII